MRLILLGEPRVVDPTGADVGLPAGKPFAALCYVALSERPVSRDALQELLWPDSPPARGKASVRQALWTLRKHLGDEVLTEDGGRLRASPALRTDLDELARAIEEARPLQALELWKGGPLARLDLVGAPAWSSWKDRLVTSWERRLGDLLDVAADAARGPERVRLLEHARDLRPFRPAGHVALASELVDLGRLEEAEAALGRARRELPSAEDRTLLEGPERRLREARKASLSTEEALGIRELREAVGRGAPFSRLRHAVLEAGRRNRWVVRGLCGPAGIGKTHLARHLARSARDDGFAVSRVEARPPDRDLPYGVLATVVRDLVALPGALGISRQADRVLRWFLPVGLPGDADSPERPPPPTAVGDAVADLVEAVAHETPLLLVVDQLQWADADSRAILRQLVRAGGSGPVMVLLLQRRCDPPGRNDPGSFGLRRDDWVELGRLTASDIEELLPAFAPGWTEVDRARLAREIRDLTGGNPGLVTALLRDWNPAASPEGSGDASGGPAGLPPGGLPRDGLLRATLAERIEGLSPEAREAGVRLARSSAGPARARPFSPHGGGLPWTGPTGVAAELVEWGLAHRDERGRVHLLGPPVREAFRAEGSGRRTWGSRGWAAALLGLAALLTGWGTVATRAGHEAPGGYMVVSSSSESRSEIWAPSPTGRWLREESVRISVEGVSAPFGARRPRGGTAWVGLQGSQERAPDVVLPGDPPRLLVDRGGDDNVTALSPDGRLALISTEDTAAPRFRKDVALLDLQSGDLRVIRSPAAFPVFLEWSPDGTRILTGVNHPGGADTTYVLRPDGSVEEALPTPPGDLASALYCGRDLLVAVLPPGEVARWYVREPGASDWVPTPASFRLDRSGTCSPDGSRLATVERTEEGSRIRIHERDDGRVVESFEVPYVVSRIRWLPDPVAGPVRVKVVSRPGRIPWGARRVLEARVVLSDGTLSRDSVEWRSLTPRVVSMRGDTLVANQPGRGRVVAVRDGWLRDTLAVEVVRSGPVGDEVVRLDRLATLDSAAWLTLGDVEVRTGPDSVLVLRSDPNARFFDGLMLRGLPAGQGLTVELEFRLPVTRSDRQAISLCLADHLPLAEGADPRWRQEWSARHQACGHYPAFELARFDADEARLVVDGESLGGTPVPGLPTDGWTHMGLQVRADGEVRLVVNNRVVSTHPTRMPLRPATSLDLLVQARTADTELSLRNLAIWRGPRY